MTDYIRVCGDRLLKGDEPFFSIGMYNAPDQCLEQLKAVGFNTLYGGSDKAWDEYGFYQVHCINNAVYVRGGPKEDPERFARSLEFVKGYANSPQVLSWYLMDEPEFYGVTVKDMEETAKAVKEIDPERPVMVMEAFPIPDPEDSRNFSKPVDIVGVDPYPILRGQPLSVVAGDIEAARSQSKGTKPIITILQLWQATGTRLPEWYEIRCMTYLALINRTAGIGYYAKNFFDRTSRAERAEILDPKLWAEVLLLAEEMNDLREVITSPLPTQDYRITPNGSGIHSLLRQYKGQNYLFLANPWNALIPIHIILPEEYEDVTKLYRYDFQHKRRSGPERTSKGFQDYLHPFETRIYMYPAQGGAI